MPSEVERLIEENGNYNEVTETQKDDIEKKAKVTQKVVPMSRPPPQFPQRLVKRLIDPGYAKFMKDLVTKNWAVSFENDARLQHCSVIVTKSLVEKKEDPGAFTIPSTTGILHFAKALSDLGSSTNLMSLFIYKNLGLGAPKPTAMHLLMADRTIKRPIGVLQDFHVKVESCIFPTNFVILDCEVDFEDPIILGRSFLATGHALVDMERWQIKL
ncbi:uncharacterized protein LOC125877438 [Solanum stenotomum]|uniref:uncharacterized protein LOC125877438 n=1 Tax=Solanum stenotomum TaxID=172797 RepID=UPI0020D17FE3|nr:uncharacterized protein LOC125877438 [Solanum stenotomum]